MEKQEKYDQGKLKCTVDVTLERTRERPRTDSTAIRLSPHHQVKHAFILLTTPNLSGLIADEGQAERLGVGDGDHEAHFETHKKAKHGDLIYLSIQRVL